MGHILPPASCSEFCNATSQDQDRPKGGSRDLPTTFRDPKKQPHRLLQAIVSEQVLLLLINTCGISGNDSSLYNFRFRRITLGCELLFGRIISSVRIYLGGRSEKPGEKITGCPSRTDISRNRWPNSGKKTWERLKIITHLRDA